MAVSTLNLRVKHEHVNARKDLGLVRVAHDAPDPGSTVRAEQAAKLIRYFSNLSSTPDQRTLMIPEGDYWTDPLGTQNGDNWRNFHVTGERSEHAGNAEYLAQTDASQTGGINIDRHMTRIRYVPTDDSSVFLRIDGTATPSSAPSQMSWGNMTIQRHDSVTNGGSVFVFGNPSLYGTSDSPLFRGLHLHGMNIDMGCHYFQTNSNKHHTMHVYDNSGESGTAKDYRIQKNDTGHAIKITRGYDVRIDDITCNGGGRAHIRLENCDAPVIRGFRSQLSWSALQVAPLNGFDPSGYGFASADGTPGFFSEVFVETPHLNGIVMTAGNITNSSVETGYDGNYIDFRETYPAPGLGWTPDEVIAGRYELPTGATWSVAAAATHLTVSGLPSGTDVTDYFYPYQLIELVIADGASGTAPYRKVFLIITHLDDDKIYFAGHDRSNYFYESYTSMAATTLYRFFGTATVFAGAKVAVSNMRRNCNLDHPGEPRGAWLPFRGTMTMSGTSDGPNYSSVAKLGVREGPDRTQWDVICHQCAGSKQDFDNFVIWNGGGEIQNHPHLIRAVPETREFHRPAKFENNAKSKFDYVFEPGRGVITNETTGVYSSWFPYYYMIDPEHHVDEPVALYHSGNGNWPLYQYDATKPLKFSGMAPLKPCVVTARFWSESGGVANGFHLDFGPNSAIYNTVGGWETRSAYVYDDEANMAAHSPRPFMQLIAREGVYYEWVGLSYDFEVARTSTALDPTKSVSVVQATAASGALSLTLADGQIPGQRKTIVCRGVDVHSVTLTIESHAFVDGQSYTFDAADEVLDLVWAVDGWVTVRWNGANEQPLTYLASAPASPLYPGEYWIRGVSSPGAFTILLRNTPGVWKFYSDDNSPATYNISLDSNAVGTTFTGAAAPYVINSGPGVTTIMNLTGGAAFAVVEL